MKRIATLAAALLVAGAANAADGFSVGVGLDYSSGDYGTDTTTKIFSVPVTTKYVTGPWSFKASLPWMRVEGDPDVVPGLGVLDNLNPLGRGRGRGTGGGGTTGTAESGTASGVGDLRLAATYAFVTGGATGIDFTANAKIATADEDKGLGTGANDYGIAVDVYRDFSGTTLFGGLGYTWLGESDFIDVDAVISGNLGASWKVGNGSVGLIYDYRQPASDTADDRSEITGFYSINASDKSKWQLYATKGLTDGSPNWGAGVSYSHGF